MYVIKNGASEETLISHCLLLILCSSYAVEYSYFPMLNGKR